MSPREEYHTVRLPKGWTPARIQRFADSVARLNMATHLAIENAALRRDRRALRKVTHEMVDAALLSLVRSQRKGFVLCPYTVDKALRAAIKAAAKKALKPRKTRRRKA